MHVRFVLLLALPSLVVAQAPRRESGPDSARQGPAQVGDKVAEFSFGPMLNGDGRRKLSEFRGQPILIDFWGTH
ncbi:MAG: hypothetical protein R3F56_12960 [Planctomycetota bacterium]